MSINVCNNNSMSAITSTPSGVGGGSLSLLSTQTASSSSTISFASGIDSTYKEYIVKFFDVHPATDNNTSTNYFLVNFRDGSTDYDATKTTTIFRAYHFEDDSGQNFQYQSDHLRCVHNHYTFLVEKLVLQPFLLLYQMPKWFVKCLDLVILSVIYLIDLVA